MIETKRLILRRFNKKDLNDLHEYLSQIEIHCFLEMKPKSIKDSKKQLKIRIKDEYYFAIELKDEHKVIGELSASKGSEEFGKEYNGTFALCALLNANYQSKGYMSEAGEALLDYLFNEKQARRIYAYVEDYNIASQKFCEKLGMRKEALYKEFVSFVKDENNNPIFENTYDYAILKKEWDLRRK